MPPPRERRRLVLVLLAGYLAGLVVLIAGPWGGALNRLVVRLYTFFRYDVALAPDWALPEHYGLLLNVLLFVPLGVAAVLLAEWPWWRATLAAAAASATVEVVQAAFLARVGTWTDVAANTLGALLGAVLGELVSRRRGRGPRPRARRGDG